MDPVVSAEATPLVFGGGAFLESIDGFLIGTLEGGRGGAGGGAEGGADKGVKCRV